MPFLPTQIKELKTHLLFKEGILYNEEGDIITKENERLIRNIRADINNLETFVELSAKERINLEYLALKFAETIIKIERRITALNND